MFYILWFYSPDGHSCFIFLYIYQLLCWQCCFDQYLRDVNLKIIQIIGHDFMTNPQLNISNMPTFWQLLTTDVSQSGIISGEKSVSSIPPVGRVNKKKLSYQCRNVLYKKDGLITTLCLYCSHIWKGSFYIDTGPWFLHPPSTTIR